MLAVIEMADRSPLKLTERRGRITKGNESSEPSTYFQWRWPLVSGGVEVPKKVFQKLGRNHRKPVTPWQVWSSESICRYGNTWETSIFGPQKLEVQKELFLQSG